MIGAYILVSAGAPPNNYDKYVPWYLLLASAGNLIKDTIWTTGFNGYNQGCSIYKDMNGGYYTWGARDVLLSPDPTDADNFPNYLAHLDANFNIQWIKDFPYTTGEGHRDIWKAMQLRDSSYLVVGSGQDTLGTTIPTTGWASKINKYGNVILDREYICAIKYNAYLVDAKEKSDHNIILVGEARNDTLAAWHQQDVWLVGIDSNGCEVPGCTLGVAPSISPQGGGLSLWPNPVNDKFVLRSGGAGTFVLYSIEGKEIGRYDVKEGVNNFSFPNNAAPGVYIGRFISKEGDKVEVVRVVFQP